MYCSFNAEFILSPLSGILADAVNAVSVIGDGIQGIQVADWVMPTVFLRMTGFLEQKLKCIAWDLGSIDPEIRRQLLKGKIGDMSCYDDKNKLCAQILSFIENNNPSLKIENEIDRTYLLENAQKIIMDICNKTLIYEWYADSYQFFIAYKTKEKENEILHLEGNKSIKLLDGELKKMFEAAYNHRNRCAHNVSSVQRNMPKFEILSGESAKFENYFLRFYILILLDNVFMELYKIAMELVEY